MCYSACSCGWRAGRVDEMTGFVCVCVCVGVCLYVFLCAHTHVCLGMQKKGVLSVCPMLCIHASVDRG